MRNRKHEVHLRLNDQEYKALMKNAAKCNMPQQTYLRHMCMATEPREAPSADFHKCVDELRRIGTNINQIAMLANRNGYIDRKEYLNQYLRIFDEINRLYRTMYFPDWVYEEIQAEKKKHKNKEELNEKHTQN